MENGNIRGKVTKINDDGTNVDIELITDDGVTGYVYCDSGNMGALKVGMTLELEEANIIFEHGKILYHVDDEFDGVTINGVTIRNFIRHLQQTA